MASNRSIGLHDEMLRSSTFTTEPFSPVTLSSDWSPVARLLLLTAMFVAGSIGNVFMISATMIEDHLRKRGNALLANFALADLLITGLIVPGSILAILADMPEFTGKICPVQWYIALVSCFATVLTFSATALENYARLFAPPEYYDLLTPCKIASILLVIWLAVGAVVAVLVLLHLIPDYCKRGDSEPMPVQWMLWILFAFPPILTVFVYIAIGLRVRSFRAVPAFKSHIAPSSDYEIMKTNIYAFFIFMAFWLPFVAVLMAGTASRKTFYSVAWLAMGKSCVNSLVYCLVNRHFRNAYVNLFHYCCCKTSVSFSRRPQQPVRPSGDVRVHIIPPYNMNYTSPMRARESGKTSFKRGSGARDVYEL